MQALSNDTPRLLFDVSVESPRHVNKKSVCTHLNVFRGYFWAGRKVAAEVPHNTRDPLEFAVQLPWTTRPQTFLEQRPQSKAKNMLPKEPNLHPTTVMLEFHYSTAKMTEFRFFACFDTVDLMRTGTLRLTAANNNMAMRNAVIDKSNIPKQYTVTVHLVSSSIPQHMLQTPNTQHGRVLRGNGTMRDSERLATWLHTMLGYVLTRPTPFQNLRTFVHTPKISGLFTDLPSLWETPGSNMPVIVPVYCTLNALVLNGFTRHDIQHSFHKLENIDTNRLLRTIRDIMMGFTMCKVEVTHPPSLLNTACEPDHSSHLTNAVTCHLDTGQISSRHAVWPARRRPTFCGRHEQRQHIFLARRLRRPLAARSELAGSTACNVCLFLLRDLRLHSQ